jgi:hypothetical protein
MDERNLYLSIPISQYTEEIVTVLAYDPEQVEFGRTPAGHFAIDAKEERKSIELGPYKYSGLDTYFFRVPIKQWRFNPAQAISFPFGELTYDVTPNELDAFFSNSSIYGGYLNVDYGFLDGREADFANHGAFVAKKEASLQRLVAKLTEPGDSMETKIQKLLNFVTKEIEYNWKEVYHDVETLKRPNEVLMTGTSDCSGKVILFASLLEQIDADYVLIYTGKGEYLSHIAVAVSGSFPRTNEHSFGLGGRDYFIAETTAEGFQIGNSVLVDPLISAGSLLFWQRPRDKSAITDGRSGTPLKFI